MAVQTANSEAGRISESEGPYFDTAEAIDKFREKLDGFYKAGMELVDAWDEPISGFNADEMFPLPSRLAPPLSMDEWLTELHTFYTVIIDQTGEEA